MLMKVILMVDLKEIARIYYEGMWNGNLELADEIIDAEYAPENVLIEK